MGKILFVFAASLLLACGGNKKSSSPPPPVIVQPPPPPPQGCDNGFLTSFEDIKPLITGKYNCVSCHGYMANYATWTDPSFMRDVIRRIGLGDNDQRRMPPPFKEAVNAKDRATFQSFLDDGTVAGKACRESATGSASGAQGYSSLQYVESNVLAYQQRLDDADRLNTRFANNCHQRSNWFTAIGKGLNSVSSSFNLILPTTIDPKGCVFSVDLAAYGLTSRDWDLIVQNDPFQFISNTVTGKLIRELSGADVPMLHGDNMLNIIFNNQEVYYGLLRVDLDRATQLRNLGVDPAQAFAVEEARVIGLQRTKIAINKNRMFVRYPVEQNVPPGRTGFLWVSQDIDAADVGLATSNIFENPLPFESGGVAAYLHTAEEWLWTLPNGLMGSALYAIQINTLSFLNGLGDGRLISGTFPPRFRQPPPVIIRQPSPTGPTLSSIVGVRQDAAPNTTVINLGNKFRSDIQAGLDCLSCHFAGPITVVDELKDPILQAGDIGFADLRIVRDTFGSANVNATLFNQDRRLYTESLTRLRINQFSEDPINNNLDIYRDDWDASRLAPFFFMREADFIDRLRNTNVVNQIPQILNGGAIPLETLIDVADDIALELEVYEDP